MVLIWSGVGQASPATPQRRTAATPADVDSTAVDRAELLEVFDRQLRRNPRADAPDSRIEREEHLLREIHPGWRGVTWSDLRSVDADVAIHEQIALFAPAGEKWEWKLYSYDAPDDLGERLAAAGFEPEERETVMIGDLSSAGFEFPVPDGVEIVAVADEATVAQMVAVQDEVFGGENDALALAAALGEPPAGAAFVALASGEPVAAGRMAMHPGTGFVSLWGGGVVAAQRRRGIFRALLSRARRIALDAGYRYAQVDASAMSEPIFRRLGFTAICTTTPYVMRPPGGGSADRPQAASGDSGGQRR